AVAVLRLLGACRGEQITDQVDRTDDQHRDTEHYRVGRLRPADVAGVEQEDTRDHERQQGGHRGEGQQRGSRSGGDRNLAGVGSVRSGPAGAATLSGSRALLGDGVLLGGWTAAVDVGGTLLTGSRVSLGTR